MFLEKIPWLRKLREIFRMCLAHRGHLFLSTTHLHLSVPENALHNLSRKLSTSTTDPYIIINVMLPLNHLLVLIHIPTLIHHPRYLVIQTAQSTQLASNEKQSKKQHYYLLLPNPTARKQKIKQLVCVN